MAERSIQTCIVQMDVRPAPTGDRLYRADQLLCDAVELGAELAVLPELFNTGYAYSDENFQRAEPVHGPTVTWMKRSARRWGIHLAGSLLLLDHGEIYNAMLIVAPDGQIWRYDKSYPWAWERGYFQPARQNGSGRAVVAHTALGDLGMLVCWDVAHTELWAEYAGQVDMMVICSCPPQANRPTFLLPSDVEIRAEQLGKTWASLEGEGSRVFLQMVEEQSAWLGVPTAHAVACGVFESAVPSGRGTLLGLAGGAPSLLRYLPKASQMRIRAEMVDAARITTAGGKTLAQLPQRRGESFAMAEVPLASQKPRPNGSQPPSRASQMASFFSDEYLPRLLASTYRRGVGAMNSKSIEE